jgi:hypothetical protein
LSGVGWRAQHFVWHRVKTVVHNLIIGGLYVDNLGEMIVTNVTTGPCTRLPPHTGLAL